MLPTYQPVFALDIQALIYTPFLSMIASIYTLFSSMVGPIYQPLPPFTSIINLALHAMSGGGTFFPITNSIDLFSSATTPMEHAMEKRLVEMEAMIHRILGVPTLFRKSQLHSYTDSLFVNSIALVEMPKTFSFPNMKLYNGTTDPTYHIES